MAETLAVYENRGRSADPYPVALLKVPIDDVIDLDVLHVFFEPLHVEPELLSCLDEHLFGNAAVIFKKPVVILPETALVAGREGRYCRRTGQLVVTQGEVLEKEPDFSRELFEHLLE